MHWLEKFRTEYVKKDGTQGIDRSVFASQVRRRGVGCSAELIFIIENGGITHPNIANKIALVAGATAEQRDSMVHEERRGGLAAAEGEAQGRIRKNAAPHGPECYSG